MRLMPAGSASSWLARAATALVMSLSAGPPWGGLYLKPPSRGGLCDGVMTTPSERPPLPAALHEMIARHSAGVGVYSPSAWTSVCTLLAASTSSAVRSAGADGARVAAAQHTERV